MGEFAEAAETVVTAESASLETPADTGTDETAVNSAPAADDTPASDPAVSSDATEAPPTAALTQTAATRDANGRFAGKQPGPPSTVPYSRLQESTKVARERGEEIKALKERFGWIGDQELPVFKQFWDAYKANPAQAFLDELPLLLRSRQYGAQMRQALTELVGQSKPAPAPEPDVEELEPQPDFYQDDEQGQRHWFYSAKQQAAHRAWQAKQQEKDLQPLKAFVDEARQQQAMGRLQASAQQNARQLIDGFKASPYFEPHRDAIRTKFRQYAQSMSGEAALHRAYAEVLQEVVIPSLSTADRRALATSLQAKTGASSPNPARPGLSTGGAKPPSTFAEAAERVLAGQR